MVEISDVVLWGATGQAKVLRELLAARGQRVIALFDDTPDLASPFVDVPLHRGRDGFERWRTGVANASRIGFIVAIGGEHGVPRVRIHRYLESRGLRPMIAVHPTAFVASSARLGAGTQVLPQAAVAVESTLGIACIVNTSATVDHECRIGDGVHIAGGARLAGAVVIEDFATVHTGAVILPRVRIGPGAVVGAGAVVLSDVAPWTVVVGVPARAVGTRQPQQP